MRCKPVLHRSASASDLWQHPLPAQARARVARKLGRLAWLGLALLACAPATAAEPKSLALMDFELIDEMRQYESAQARRETDRRLVLITSVLAQEFARRDM